MDLSIEAIKKKAKERPLDVAVIFVIVLILALVARPLMSTSDPAIAKDKAAQDVLTNFSESLGKGNKVTPPPGAELISGNATPQNPNTILTSGTLNDLSRKGQPWFICNRSKSKKYFCVISDSKGKSFGASYGFLAARVGGKPNF